MDAHLFGILVSALLPLLAGARIEKIQEFAANHLALTFFGAGQKRYLYFRFGRRDPFAFLSHERISGIARPSAQIMRLRKYFTGKKIAAVVPQIWSRKLWLMASQGNEDQEKTTWLCLDLAQGASLHFLKDGPEPEDAIWPERNVISHAIENWRAWPILTPALRKTLNLLPPAEQAALLADLADGGGDLFLYSNSDHAIKIASAWPLAPAQAKGLSEEVFEDQLIALEKTGHDLVFRSLFEAENKRQAAPVTRRQRQIQKLLLKLDADEARLERMAAYEAPAKALAANLWQLDGNAKLPLIELDGQRIALQERFSVAENMERMFHEMRRGKRGLAMLSERRAALMNELNGLESENIPIQNKEQPEKVKIQSTPLNLPKHTEAFRSSDGYLILRGKDAKGNLAIRRLASGHDIWAHVEQGTGAHVIIRRPHPAHELPEQTLIEAGTLAANKSWLSAAASGAVMYAEVRHVKPERGGPVGKVKIDKLRETRIVPIDHGLEERLARG